MRFIKNLSTFIVSGLLATSALGELTQVPRGAALDVVAREDEAAAQAIARRTRAQRRAAECREAMAKRGLSGVLVSRASKSIQQNEDGSGKGSDSIQTVGLATCIGISITGKYPEAKDKDDRFMAHVDPAMDDAYNSMIDKVVKAVKDEGLQITEAVISYPAVDSFKDADEWDDDARNDIKNDNDFFIKDVQEATGVKPTEKPHDYKDPQVMKIASDKTISVGRF